MSAARSLPFRLISQTIQLLFHHADEQRLKSVREAALAMSGDTAHLVLNQVQTRPDFVALQSKTGSTSVQVSATLAVMQTQFFGDYAKVEANEERLRYAQSKTAHLLAVLQKAGVEPLYCDISTIARLPVAQSGYSQEQLVGAAAAAFSLRGPFSESVQPYDFLMRVSRVVEPTYFSNIWLATYETRTIEMAFSAPMPQPLVFFDWMGNLVEQGLEFKYDRNNKKALYAGRPAAGQWPLELIASSINDFPSALKSVSDAIGGKLP